MQGKFGELDKREQDVKLTYQGKTLGMEFRFSRSVGLNPDSGAIQFPPGIELVAGPKVDLTEGRTPQPGEPSFPRTEVTGIGPGGDLILVDRATLAKEAASEVKLHGIFLSGDGVVRTKEFIESVSGGPIEITSGSILDYRWLWEDCGYVIGDRNCIADPRKEPFVLIRGLYYKPSTLMPGAQPGRSWDASVTEKLKDDPFFSSYEIQKSLVRTERKVRVGMEKIPLGYSPKKEVLLPGFGDRWSGRQLIKECLESLAYVAKIYFYPKASARVSEDYPPDLKWGTGEHAGDALRDLLSYYGLEISIRVTDAGAVDVFIPGEGQEVPTPIAHLAKRETGVAYKIPPEAIMVSGEQDLLEFFCTEYEYVIEDLEGRIRPLYSMLKSWGLDPLTVRRGAYHSDESERYKGLKLGKDELSRKKLSLIKKCAFKWLKLPLDYEEYGSLQALMDFGKKGLVKKRILVGATISLPVSSKVILKEGCWRCQYFWDAEDYIDKIDAERQIVQFSEPVLLVVPAGSRGKGFTPSGKMTKKEHQKWKASTRDFGKYHEGLQKKTDKLVKDIKALRKGSKADLARLGKRLRDLKGFLKELETTRVVSGEGIWGQVFVRESTLRYVPVEGPSYGMGTVKPPSYREVHRKVLDENCGLLGPLWDEIKGSWVALWEALKKNIYMPELGGIAETQEPPHPPVPPGVLPGLPRPVPGPAVPGMPLFPRSSKAEKTSKEVWIPMEEIRRRALRDTIATVERLMKQTKDHWDGKISKINEQLNALKKDLKNIEQALVYDGLFSVRFAGKMPVGRANHFSVVYGPRGSSPSWTALVKTKLFRYTSIDGTNNQAALLLEAKRLAEKYQGDLSVVTSGVYTFRGFHPIDCGPLVDKVEWRTDSSGAPTTTVHMNSGKAKLVKPQPLYKGPKDEPFK